MHGKHATSCSPEARTKVSSTHLLNLHSILYVVIGLAHYHSFLCLFAHSLISLNQKIGIFGLRSRLIT